VNSHFQYYDLVKIKEDLIKVLTGRISASNLLRISGITIQSMNEEQIIVSASDQSIIDLLKGSHIQHELITFFCDRFYQDVNKPNLVFQIQPEEIPKLAKNFTQAEGSQKGLVQGLAEKKKGQLNPDYTFDTFVLGNSNSFAFHHAQAVSTAPGDKKHNPYFIYGGVGLGKTHLLHAISHKIIENEPECKVRYVSCEALLNEYIDAVRRRDSKIKKVRELDVLVVDDIQILSGKDAFQEEFRNIFNSLLERNAQIVLAADRTPPEIKGLTDRLISRFSSGLLADIKLPDLETRMAIIGNLSRKHGIFIDNDCTEYLASSISSNVRELQGAFIRIMSLSSFEKCDVTSDLIDRALSELHNTSKKELTPEIIQKEVAQAYGVSREELLSDSRVKQVSYPRQVAMSITRDMTDLTLQEIADAFIKKDHVTVSHACRKVEQSKKSNSQENLKILQLIQKLERDYKAHLDGDTHR